MFIFCRFPYKTILCKTGFYDAVEKRKECLIGAIAPALYTFQPRNAYECRSAVRACYKKVSAAQTAVVSLLLSLLEDIQRQKLSCTGVP